MSPQSKSPESDRDKPIEVLGEKDFIFLYNLGKTIRINKGEVLFREGDLDRTVYLVLKGTLESVTKTKGGRASIFRENDWIGEMLFFPPHRKISTVVAADASTLLSFNQSTFERLDPRIQLFALKRMNDLDAVRLECLTQEYTKASQTSAYYRAFILDLIRERNDDYEKSDTLYAIIKSIPRLPVYTTKLVHMLLSESASVREVTEIAREDPSLVSEILKTINSSYYNLKRRVSDLQYAVMYLGFYQVYQIVVSNGLLKVMPNTPEFMGIHHHSVLVSHLVFEICQLCDKRDASTMSTIALLHDIGRSVILLMKAKNPKLSFFIELLDPQRIGAMLLKEWNIPEAVCQTVRYQHYPSFSHPADLPSEYMKRIAYLYMAHACHEYMQGEMNNILRQPFINDYLSLLDVSGCRVDEYIEKYVIGNLKLKMNTLPKHVQAFLCRKIELNIPT